MPIDPRLPARLKTVNQQLLDRGIRHAVFLQSYKTQEVNKIVRFLNNSVVPDLLDKLAVGLPKVGEPGYAAALANNKRYQDMLAGVAGILKGGVREAGSKLKADLKDLAISEAEWQAKVIKDILPVTIDFKLPSSEMLRTLVSTSPIHGHVLDDWFEGLSKGTQLKISQQLAIGLTEGETIDQLIARIRGTKAGNFQDGVIEQSRRTAEAIVRTSVTHVSAVSREKTYEENSDVVDKVQWVSTLDSRTTIICASRDGHVYPVNEGPRPPAHPNCRSCTVPVTKSWEDLGIKAKEAPIGVRASMDGEVPASTTYSQWLKDQPEKVQDKVLGKGKADIFRKGKLPLEKFVDDQGHELTLDELRALEGQEPLPKPEPKPEPKTKEKKPVAFGADTTKQYPDGPVNKITDQDVEQVLAILKEQDRLNGDGTISLHHATLEDRAGSILNKGLIPGKEVAPGQSWEAEHASYATYFHQIREVALRDLESGNGGLVSIEARIPVSKTTLARFIPDEESDVELGDVVELIRSGQAVGVVGGVPKQYLRVLTEEDLKALESAKVSISKQFEKLSAAIDDLRDANPKFDKKYLKIREQFFKGKMDTETWQVEVLKAYNAAKKN